MVFDSKWWGWFGLTKGRSKILPNRKKIENKFPTSGNYWYIYIINKQEIRPVTCDLSNKTLKINKMRQFNKYKGIVKSYKWYTTNDLFVNSVTGS